MNNPQHNNVWNSLLAQQKRLETIEEMFDTVNPRTWTPDILSLLSSDLNNIIKEIRGIPDGTMERYIEPKQLLLANLRQARMYLQIAIDQSSRGKANPTQFYKSLRECQVFLMKALDAFSKIG